MVSSKYSPKKSVAVPLSLTDACTKVSSQTELSVQSLYAGLLSKVKILKILPSGLVVRLLDFFNASIPLSSLDVTLGTLEERYNTGDSILARIVHVDYENKTIHMSCKDHILQWKPASFASSIGDTIEEAVVVRTMKDYGLFLGIASQPPQTAFVHVSVAQDFINV